jgi:hypothetical protein
MSGHIAFDSMTESPDTTLQTPATRNRLRFEIIMNSITPSRLLLSYPVSRGSISEVVSIFSPVAVAERFC